MNTAPEDFSVKSHRGVSRDLDIQGSMKTEDVDTINGAFDLTPNNQATDLSFNMYSEKAAESPANSLYRNNPDPYLGSGAHSGGRSSNGSASHSGQDEFDIRSHQSSTFTAVSSDLAPSLPSYLGGNDGQSLVSNSSLGINQPRTHPSNDASTRFNFDGKISEYRPSSANSFSATKHNSGTDLRGSPIVGQSQISESGAPSPISPSYYSGIQGHEKSSSNLFSGSCYDYKSSAFKPLPNSHQNHAHSSFASQNPSPHSYQHGPSPPMPGQFHQNVGFIPGANMDRNVPPHAYSQSASDFDYGSSNFRKRPDLSIDSDHSHHSRQQQSANQTNSNQPSHNPSESEQSKKVIVPAGKWRTFLFETLLM